MEAFDTGYEVEPYFLDHAGDETTDVWIDTFNSGGEWVYFWNKKKESCGGQSARLNHNRNRRRNGEEDTDMPDGYRRHVEDEDI